MLMQEELKRQAYQLAMTFESRRVDLLCAQAVLGLAIENLSTCDSKEVDALYGAENLFISVIDKAGEDVDKAYDLWRALRESNE